MIQRYSRAEMRDIWTEQRKLEIWLQIELLAAEALVAEGIVPAADFAQMKAKAAFSIERCKELEKTLNHDVIAFTTNVAENIGAPASRWLHFGLTSSDIIDTAFAVQMTQSADILIADVKALREVIAAQGARAPIHADDRPQPRHPRRADHFRLENGADARRIHAAPCNGWRRRANAVAVGKLSGAVGTSAHLSPRVEAFVCAQVGPASRADCHAGRPARFARGIHRRPGA